VGAAGCHPAVCIERLEEPAIELEPDARSVAQAVTTFESEPKGRIATSTELVRGELQLANASFQTDPPRPGVLFLLGLRRVGEAGGY
jgi:hypothetical protein